MLPGFAGADPDLTAASWNAAEEERKRRERAGLTHDARTVTAAPPPPPTMTGAPAPALPPVPGMIERPPSPGASPADFVTGDAPAAAAPPSVQDPTRLHRESETTSTTSRRTKISGNERMAAVELQGNAMDQADAARNLARTEAEGHAAAGEAAQIRAGQLDRQAGDQKTIIEAGEAEYRRRLGRYEEAEKAFAAKEYTHLLAKKSTGERLGMLLAVALSGVGQALNAAAGRATGENGALAVIQKAVEDDFQIQRANIEKEGRQVDRLRADADAVRRDTEFKLRVNQVQQATVLEKLAEEARAKASKSSSQAARDRGELVAKGLEATALQIKKGVAETERQDVSTTVQRNMVSADPGMAGGRGGVVTDAQGQAEAKIRRMADAYNTIQALPPLSPQALEAYKQARMIEDIAAKNPKAALVARKAGMLKDPIAALKPDEQKAILAWKSAHETVLRAETGAGATIDEANRTADRIVPQPFDSPQVKAYKTEQFKKYYESEMVRVNPGRVQGLQSDISRPAAAPQGEGKRIVLKDGRRGILYANGDFEEQK